MKSQCREWFLYRIKVKKKHSANALAFLKKHVSNIESQYYDDVGKPLVIADIESHPLSISMFVSSLTQINTLSDILRDIFPKEYEVKIPFWS